MGMHPWQPNSAALHFRVLMAEFIRMLQNPQNASVLGFRVMQVGSEQLAAASGSGPGLVRGHRCCRWIRPSCSAQCATQPPASAYLSLPHLQVLPSPVPLNPSQVPQARWNVVSFLVDQVSWSAPPTLLFVLPCL